MAQLQLIKQSSGILIPATPETSDLLQSKIKLGAMLVADFKQVRNSAFHRRFFALLNLGFEYWEPTGGAISSNERKLVTGYAKFLASYGGNEGALLDAAEQYLGRIADKRTGSISACKSFDAYRAWVTIESGHYDAIQLPDGTLKKHPRSISFAQMDETGVALGTSGGTILNGVLTKLSPDEWSAVGVLAGIVGIIITGLINWYFKRKVANAQVKALEKYGPAVKVGDE